MWSFIKTIFHLAWTDGLLYIFKIGSSIILEICGQQIIKSLSILDQIPLDWFKHQSNDTCLLEGIPNSDLLSSLTIMQNHIFICDTGFLFLLLFNILWLVILLHSLDWFTPNFCVSLVGQRIMKVNRESGVFSNFQLSNLGTLGLPYWLNSPLETFYAA